MRAAPIALASQRPSVRDDQAKGRALAARAARAPVRRLRQRRRSASVMLDDASPSTRSATTRRSPRSSKAGHPDRRYAAASGPPRRASRRSRSTVSIRRAPSARAGSWPRRDTARSRGRSAGRRRRSAGDGLGLAPPVVAEEAKDHLAERQAGRRSPWSGLGKAETVWPLLRHSTDPRLRSFIVNWLNPLGADPRLTQLARTRTASIRPPPSHPPPGSRWTPSSSTPRPRAAGPDPGAGDVRPRRPLPRRARAPDRQAARPLPQRPRRRHPRRGRVDAAAVEQQAEARARSTLELTKLKDRGDRRWFVNSQGQTFALIDGPVEFRMGSPPTEPDRIAAERAPAPP